MEDKTANKGRMFVAKNRNGIDGIVFPMEINTAKVHLRVLPPDEDSSIDAVVVKTKQEQDEHLRQKYKKFKAQRDKKVQAAQSAQQKQAEHTRESHDKSTNMRNGLRALKEKLVTEEQTQQGTKTA
jgi:hypothetical protein